VPHIIKTLLALVGLVVVAILATPPVSGQSIGPVGLVVYGDVVEFLPPTHPLTCLPKARFKRGEGIGFRMTAINPQTGRRDRATALVVHITYGGRTIDVPMRDRQNERQPEREFWVARWEVPADAPIGAVRYSVTATDPQGRTGSFTPFEVQNSQLTVVE
jgi:hypothetical protein